MSNEQTLCKGCYRQTHPAYLDRYDGYCLDCSNQGVDERDERIAALESELAASQAREARLREALEIYGKPANWKAQHDFTDVHDVFTEAAWGWTVADAALSER